MDKIPFLEQLEQSNDESQVRINIDRKLYSPKHKAIAQEWLRSKEEYRALSSSNLRDAREEESLSIAKEALSIAKEANRIASEDLAAARSSASSAAEQARWARWSAIIATTAAIIAAKEQITSMVISWLQNL